MIEKEKMHIEKTILLKKELDTLRPFSKDDESRIMQKFRLDWNYHSNHLEGNSLSYGETKALILFGITAQGKPLKDHFEITGHNEAINLVLDVVKDGRPITENFIREIHKLLLKESYEVAAKTPEGEPTKKKIEVGQYKSSPNHVETKTGEIFRFATPAETPAKMHDLINWLREEETKLSPLLLATQFHYKFIRIHPFDDGNGRTARILMNFILMKHGFPPVVIKTEDKENYFAALRQADAGLFEPFLEYIAMNLNHSMDIMIRGAKGGDIEDEDDLEKELYLLQAKLNEIGKPVSIKKNDKAIQLIFNDSFKKVKERYDAKIELLNGFYFSIKRKMYYDKNIIPSLNVYLDNVKMLRYFVRFEGFKTVELGSLNFDSNLIFLFEESYYKVSPFHNNFNILFKNPTEMDVKNVTYKKSYNEQLTNEEIESIVNFEIRRNKAYIESKIKELK